MAQTKASTQRNIVVYYFTDSTRLFSLSGTTRWFKYARSASNSAHDALVHNLYGANVAVVHDDEIGKDLMIFVRHADNRVETAWDASIMKEKYLSTSKDKFGSFTKKLAKTASKRKMVEVEQPKRKGRR